MDLYTILNLRLKAKFLAKAEAKRSKAALVMTKLQKSDVMFKK